MDRVVTVRITLEDPKPNLGDKRLEDSVLWAVHAALVEHDLMPVRNWLGPMIVSIDVEPVT